MRAFAAEQRRGLLNGAAAGGGGGGRLDILVNNAGGWLKRGVLQRDGGTQPKAQKPLYFKNAGQ